MKKNLNKTERNTKTQKGSLKNSQTTLVTKLQEKQLTNRFLKQLILIIRVRLQFEFIKKKVAKKAILYLLNFTK